jgi:hypothetical protein
MDPALRVKAEGAQAKILPLSAEGDGPFHRRMRPHLTSAAEKNLLALCFLGKEPVAVFRQTKGFAYAAFERAFRGATGIHGFLGHRILSIQPGSVNGVQGFWQETAVKLRLPGKFNDRKRLL